MNSIFDSLILRYRNGDREAACELLKMVKPIILKSVKILCFNSRDSMDMVQQGCLIALEAAKTYRIGGQVSYGAYLKKALYYGFCRKNRSIMKNAGMVQTLNEWETVECIPDEKPGVEEAALENERYEKLYEVIHMLNDRQRKIIIERYFYNKKLSSIAKSMGVQYFALLKEHQRILKKLKVMLNQSFDF